MEPAIAAAEPRASAPPSPAKQALRILWRDHLRMGLGTRWIALAGYRRGLRPALVHQDVIGLERPDAPIPWSAAVAAIPDALIAGGRSRPAVTVVLSNDFVRYAVLPWSAALKGEAEWLALARHRFSSVHGPVAEEWEIRVAPVPRGRPRIASAVDAALLAALKERINARASLVSVQPYLMAAYNRLQAVLATDSCWLVIQEPGRIALALIQNGTWRAIRNRRLEDARSMTLPRLLDRESALLGLEAPCTDVAVVTHLPFEAGTQGTYRLRDLTLLPGAPESDRTLAMALE